ncbi:ABC transporter ATP-binding protein [Paenibacillus thermotolerans]|uniref:ABC transporter ATP-binding protein n=1 Tax=Paenibacillus thermotolerans TaxID=3027807 RepID=UPI002368B3A9|nr:MULTISPECIES: ABC transporter ATP-binding protein [unclassified Paenibacillus]
MIRVEELRFTYPGKRDETLKGLDFSVLPGEIFGFLGPSGAGKSTTQNILIGSLKGYEGSVTVFGKELKTINKDYYEKIGVAFEFPSFYQRLTALENLNLFRALYNGRTADPNKLLESVGLSEAANVRVSQFSKGMKMRLNFCRALLNDPDLLFLDEPTSGLDPVNAKRMKDLILQMKADGKTIFLTTHNMNIAEELCDRVAFMAEGAIRLIDEPRALKIRSGGKKVRVEYRESGKLVREDFELDRLAADDRFMRLIGSGNIETIHTTEATLEHIFIQVTGKELIS